MKLNIWGPSCQNDGVPQHPSPLPSNAVSAEHITTSQGPHYLASLCAHDWVLDNGIGAKVLNLCVICLKGNCLPWISSQITRSWVSRKTLWKEWSRQARPSIPLKTLILGGGGIYIYIFFLTYLIHRILESSLKAFLLCPNTHFQVEKSSRQLFTPVWTSKKKFEPTVENWHLLASRK